MSKFKAGDMAMIVGCHRDPRNIGSTCTLVQFIKAGDEYELSPGHKVSSPIDAWLVEGPQVIGAYFNWKCGIIDTPGNGLADQKHLMPLKGDFQPEQQKAKEVEA
ncbi:hypothetical protein [Pseudomonas pseudonitroreducens]|uniref:hypothetical protein n=2 Tax=Pseudomonas pseudonitroreducens TaxID=2892326 RepID=UPI001F42294D|nr:hypothetical protein [Pseudomonas pseudonitroreducens]